MMRNKWAIVGAALTIVLPPAAKAQWAVIDVGAIAQLIQEAATLKQQLSTIEQQLTQAQQQFQSMTGTRGMQALLSGINRNYFPANSAQLTTALATPIQSIINSNAVLSAQQMAAFSPAQQQQLNAARGNAALLQVTTRQAYSTASNRFASVQQLISAIPTATDQKGILDLQARIQAELGMLQNEQTKLQVLFQLVQAQELSRKQRVQEQALADVGSVRNLPPIGLLP
jgi:type IV secretion system protein VirB5